MCGIAGIVSFGGASVTEAELDAMNSSMVHRGPNDAGTYLDSDAQAGLCMRRLSIIDVEGGHQPISNEDGTVWVVQNGEIYNYRELAGELTSRGHVLSSKTDTEVIVHLYEELGERCVERLRGMFALAIWDTRRRRLLLARDRIGIKPLYYGWYRGRLLFASELKAILALPEVQPEVNLGSLEHLLTFLTTPRGESFVAGVRKLEPAHLLSVTRRGAGETPRVVNEPYWSVQFQPEQLPIETWEELLREAIRESVSMHMVSDVPLGAFSSGGVDSASVVGTMTRIDTQPVRTFSIGFKQPEFNEPPYARMVAHHFGTQHHELILEPNVLQVIDDIVWHLDEPFGDPSAIPTYMVSQLASEEVTVVLSGDGGDELFAGYDRYGVERWERFVDYIPGMPRRVLRAVGGLLPQGTRGKRFLLHHGLRGAERQFDSRTLFAQDELLGVLHPDVIAQLPETHWWRHHARWLQHGNWLSSMQCLDLNTYLPLDVLTKVDRMSMAHSLEVRVPLLDHRVVELAARIPPRLQMREGVSKYLLKRAMRDILPGPVLRRPKRGFAVPLNQWFRGELQGFARDVLLDGTSRARGILDPVGVQALLSRHASGRNLDLQIWTLISMELWFRRFGTPMERTVTDSSVRSTRRANSKVRSCA